MEPQPVDFITQAPSIKDAQYIWRSEETVRSAMIQTGEADLSWAVSIDQAEPINNSEHGKTVKVVSGEVYTINVDTIWHPELRKLEVRQALTPRHQLRRAGPGLLWPRVPLLPAAPTASPAPWA